MDTASKAYAHHESNSLTASAGRATPNDMKELERSLETLRALVSRVDMVADRLNRFDARIIGAPLAGQTEERAPKPVPNGLVGCINESLCELERHVVTAENTINHLDTIA